MVAPALRSRACARAKVAAACHLRAAVGFIDWLGELGVRHDSDIGTFVPRVLDDTPAEMRKEIRSAGREEINGGIIALQPRTQHVR